MKKFLIIIFALSVTFHSSCSKSQSNQSENPFNYNTLKIVNKKVTHFKELGRISRAIKLETTEDALIGEVSHVMIDDITQDILVADFRSAKKVFRFNKEGRFLTSYGKLGEGPGEYTHLNEFTLCPNGDIVLLSDEKLVKFSREGDLLLEKVIDYYTNDIIVVDNLFYISINYYRNHLPQRNSIYVLNKDFEIIDKIANFDNRLDKFLFTTLNFLALKDENLYFLDYYDLKLHMFAPKQKKIHTMSIPNDNLKLNQIWKKNRLNEKDNSTIINNLHRFCYIYACKDGLILFEICRKKNIYNLWLFNPTQKKAIIFSYFSLCRNYNLKFQPDLFFDMISGSYDEGVIGVLDTIDEFNAYKDNYPALKNLSLNTEENSILVFFEFDIDKIKNLN